MVPFTHQLSLSPNAGLCLIKEKTLKGLLTYHAQTLPAKLSRYIIEYIWQPGSCSPNISAIKITPLTAL